eukprot:760719-Hanusia_phi.AAC.3
MSVRMSSSSNKVALVTGSTDGIGRHTALKLAQEGYDVIIHGRNPKRIDDTLSFIKSKCPNARLESFQADFAKLDDVRKLGNDISTKYKCIDVLINNAGVYEERMQKTADGFEMTFQVNVLAGFLLTSLLMDTVAKAEEPRIIITSSISQGNSVAKMNGLG